MSFILDALKKSEAERQRQDAPGIANIPESGAKKTGSKWIWIISGLLAVNLVVLAGIMLKPDEATESTAVEETTGNISPQAAADSFSEIVREAKRGSAESDRAESVETAPEIPGGPAADSAPAIQQAPAVTTGLPTFNDLRAAGTLQLPDMHLDIHVYSGQPADRFVFINMSKYKENATLSEGPSISEITPDGVVLDYRGTQFLLPRE